MIRVPFRPATIDEFPEIRLPNQAQTEKRVPNGVRPPLRQPALTSRNFIRNDLRRRTGARVSPAAVDAVQAILDSRYDDLAGQAVNRYQTEANLRASHGANDHRLTFQPRHVVPPLHPRHADQQQHGGDAPR